MKVELSPEEIRFARIAGDNRLAENKGKQNIPDYDTRFFNLSDRDANRFGVYAEAGAFKALGGNVLKHDLTEWAHFVPNDHPDYEALIKGQADLNIHGLSVEVRRANSPANPVPVRGKDKKAGVRVLQVYVPYSQPLPSAEDPLPKATFHGYVELLGWAYPTDAGVDPRWKKQAGSIVVPRRPMSTFEWVA